MAERQIRECDHCGREIKATSPYMEVTIHSHHPRKVQLCLPCDDTLRRWLTPGMSAPGRILEQDLGEELQLKEVNGKYILSRRDRKGLTRSVEIQVQQWKRLHG